MTTDLRITALSSDGFRSWKKQGEHSAHHELQKFIANNEAIKFYMYN